MHAIASEFALALGAIPDGTAAAILLGTGICLGLYVLFYAFVIAPMKERARALRDAQWE